MYISCHLNRNDNCLTLDQLSDCLLCSSTSNSLWSWEDGPYSPPAYCGHWAIWWDIIRNRDAFISLLSYCLCLCLSLGGSCYTLWGPPPLINMMRYHWESGCSFHTSVASIISLALRVGYYIVGKVICIKRLFAPKNCLCYKWRDTPGRGVVWIQHWDISSTVTVLTLENVTTYFPF